MTTTIFNQQGKKANVYVTSKIEKMEEALRNINFFVSGLTDEAIEHY